MLFEWDPIKDKVNREKHGLSFDEVKQLFTMSARKATKKEVHLFQQYHGGTND